MATLIDGLGKEEIVTISGATLETQNVFVTGSTTVLNQISGLNIYATGSIATGRLVGVNVISGNDLFATGSITAGRVFGTAQVSGLEVYATNNIAAGGSIVVPTAGVVSTFQHGSWVGSIQAHSFKAQAGGGTSTFQIGSFVGSVSSPTFQGNTGSFVGSVVVGGAGGTSIFNNGSWIGSIIIEGPIQVRNGSFVGSIVSAQANLTGSILVVGGGGTSAFQTGSFVGSTIAVTIIGMTAISGNQIFSTGSVIGARIANTDGVLFSVSAGSPGTYGVKIQTGSVVTTTGSAGTVTLATQFANTGYEIFFNPKDFYAGAGSIEPYASGTRNVSGCEMVGAASVTYSWMAVGV